MQRWAKFALFRRLQADTIRRAQHGKQEKAANIATASHLANHHGYRIDLLPVPPQGKSPDAYNHTLKREQEFKKVSTPTNNAIQMAIKSAKRQANSIVINLPESVKLGDLNHALINRMRRESCAEITDITIIIGNKDATYTRAQIIADGFKISRGDFK